jgi:hypothetical protein
MRYRFLRLLIAVLAAAPIAAPPIQYDAADTFLCGHPSHHLPHKPQPTAGIFKIKAALAAANRFSRRFAVPRPRALKRRPTLSRCPGTVCHTAGAACGHRVVRPLRC